jgi:hypothetical protein
LQRLVRIDFVQSSEDLGQPVGSHGSSVSRLVSHLRNRVSETEDLNIIGVKVQNSSCRLIPGIG